MAKNQKPPEDQDDGYTVADMNVEGMPWYDRNRFREEWVSQRQNREPMSPSERRPMLLMAVLASLAVAAAFGVVYFVFILLLDSFAR